MSFALTIFISAFFLFQVQPIIARYILPWYGGSPAVWSTCMLFFQVGLLTGYIYAHLLARYLGPRKQALFHIFLLTASLFMLPITPDAALKPIGADDPVRGIIRLLLFTVGVPYVLISSTGPLLQHWYRLKYVNRFPYRLYALSNLGSLLGLFSYPFLVEPNIILGTQTLRSTEGVYKEDKREESHRRKLYNGQINHGLQLLHPSRKGRVVSYYSAHSGLGIAFRKHPKRLYPEKYNQPGQTSHLQVGVIGLGIGVIASWGEAGEVLHFGFPALSPRYATSAHDSSSPDSRTVLPFGGL